MSKGEIMKQKYLVLLLAVLLTGVLFFTTSSAMINRNLRKINNVDNRIRRAQEQLNSAKVLNDELKEVSIVIENSLTTNRELSNEEANHFVRELADLTDRYKITVLALFPKVSYAQGRVLEQQFNLEIESTYVQLGQLLASIESYDYILKVNTLDVRPLTDRFIERNEIRETLYKVALDLSIFKIVKES